MRLLKPRILAAAAFAVIMAFFVAGEALANLTISPLRFVFEHKVRSHSLLVMNNDAKPHTYRLGWKLMKMDENGQYHDIPPGEAGTYSVPRMVDFSPRQVTLAGGGRQQVRLRLKRPADLPPGEYRGHLLFEEVLPKEDPAPAAAGSGQGPSLKINVALGFTVPVIVRAGDIKPAGIAFSAPRIQAGKDKQLLNMDIMHTPGKSSVYGQVLVKRKGEQVGVLSNVALYPEMEKRILNIPLTQNLPVGSDIEVSYVGDGEYKGKTFASKQVTVQQ